MGRAGVGATALLLADRQVSGGARTALVQQVGAVSGNRQVQRLLAQRQAAPARPVLRMGSHGPNVRTLQQALVQAGAPITADGAFGPKTRQAVLAFQGSAGLVADGVVGAKTWSAVDAGGTVISAGPGSAVDQKAAAVVKAKLLEVQLLMRRIAAQRQPETASGEVAQTAEHPAAPHHDDEDGESSWWDDVTGAVGDAVGGVVDTVTETVSEIVDGVVETAGEVVESVTSAAGAVTEGVSEVVTQVVHGAQAAAGAVTDSVDAVVQGVVDVASGVGQAAEEFVGDLGEAYADEIAAVKAFVDDVANFLADPAKALEHLEAILVGLKKKASELFGDESPEGPEVLEGTVDGDAVSATATVCDTAIPPSQGTQPRRLVLDLSGDVHEREQPDGAVESNTGQLNYDRVSPTLSYASVETMNDDSIAKVPSTDFGTTGSTFSIPKMQWRAERGTDFVTVNGRLLHQISYAIGSSGKYTDVSEDLSTIDADNWNKAADDLDPDLHKTELGAPKRSKFWCKDITTAHEKFHVGDATKFTREVITPAVRVWMASRSIDVPYFLWRETEVEKQVKTIATGAATIAKDRYNTYMNPPGGELRAYGADEAAYRARAKAIRAKAKREGWPPKA